MENWRFIKENNDYMVSDHGRIMSLKKPQKKILSSSLLHNGYEAIYIYQKGIHAARYVHRLVAETFIPNPKKLPQVNHLDGNTLNNHVSNLEWCDAYDNLMHAIRTGLRPVNVPRSIPCAVTDESGTILHPYPSMKSMVKEEKLNSAQYSWLQLKLTHPERVRLHTMRRWHLPYLPIPPDCTPVRHSVTRQYYRLLSAEEAAALARFDAGLPGRLPWRGSLHPVTMVMEEICTIFKGLGYDIVSGPEVETDYYCFEALNIPANHPAKDEQDTFYINDKIVLRTQTSPVQVREMEKGHLPIRMIAPGRVFRADEVDATHSPSFHQIEGLVVDKNITFSDLKGTLAEFARQLFGQDTKVKFRPHHFPFTEPSAEMDVTCFKCGGKGCRFCKGEGWIEILGCGMVHPRVLRMSGIDPEEYSGFAFGIGLERIALLKYEIDDMRLLYENDQRFLNQF